MKRILAWAAPACTLLLAGSAFAGGFNIYEMGARATALGGAFTATADDASAIFYNPAGTAWLQPGWTASLDVALIMPKQEFALATGVGAGAYTGDATSSTKSAIFTPGGLYGAYRHSDRWSFGLGVFTPFGLGVEWDDPDTFAGRSLSINAQIQGIYMSPVATWSPNPHLALSGGFHAVMTGLDLDRILTQSVGSDVGSQLNVADVALSGHSDISYGPAFAAMIRPNENFSFGINFKGGVTNKFEDDTAEFTQRLTGNASIDAAVAANLASLGGEGEQGVSGELDYPSILVLGVRMKPSPKVSLMVDYVWFDWSVFDEVVLEFESAGTTTLIEEYEDGEQWRFGFEYQKSPTLRFMCGYVRDFSPQPRLSISPLLPDANRNDYSVGLSWQRNNTTFTASYMLVDFDERSTVKDGVGLNESGFDGTYNAVAHIPTIGVTHAF